MHNSGLERLIIMRLGLSEIYRNSGGYSLCNLGASSRGGLPGPSTDSVNGQRPCREQGCHLPGEEFLLLKNSVF